MIVTNINDSLPTLPYVYLPAQPLSEGAGAISMSWRGPLAFQRTDCPTFMQSFIWGRIMQSASASELGYANTALMLGLLDVLATKGILTRSDLNTIIVAAISKLEPTRNIENSAIDLIKSLFSKIHGSD